MDKKLKKELSQLNKKKEMAKSFGSIFPEAEINVRIDGKDEVVNLITPSLTSSSLTRKNLKEVFSIDIEKDVFKRMIKIQNEINGESDELKVNMLIATMLLEEFIDPLLSKAINNSIKEEVINGKTKLFVEKSEEFLVLEKILNRFIDYERDLGINEDEIGENAIKEILILLFMYLAIPSR